VAHDVVTSPSLSKEKKPRESTGTLQELFISLIWLIGGLVGEHATLTGNGPSLNGALAAAAGALPGLLSSAMVTGASLGAALGSRYDTVVRRLAAGVGVGLLFGAIVTVGMRLAYGTTPSIMVLAISAGAASVVGGAFAFLPGEVLEAALWATFWVFFANLIFGVLHDQIATMLGGGPKASDAAQVAADVKFVYIEAIGTALWGALHLSNKLRRHSPGAAWFIVGGAFPGVVLVLSEVMTQPGGATMAKLVKPGALGDSVFADLTDFARLRYALIVLAAGAAFALFFSVRAKRS
jgi:hypothetical protein